MRCAYDMAWERPSAANVCFGFIAQVVAYLRVARAAALSLNPRPGTVSTLSSLSVFAFLLDALPPFSSSQFSKTPMASLMFFTFSAAFVTVGVR